MNSQITRRALLGASVSLPFVAAAAPAQAAGTAVQDSRALFNPQNYIARGTVFTRSVKNMPLASNSAQLAQAMAKMPSKYAGTKFPSLKTSLNSVSYNIPIYVVDSRVAGCPTKSFVVTREDTKNDSVVSNAKIPCPTYAKPAWGNDKALAIYDMGTGILREYFKCEPTATGYTAGAAGWSKLNAPIAPASLAAKNFAMQLTRGSSAVVRMHNPLSQVGLAELKAGVINHAVSFTFANAAPGFSWPAQDGDGKLNETAPVQGQWFRIPPDVDLGKLGLNPFTLMVARAVQRYGGYGADKNLWCHSVNIESPFSWNSDSSTAITDSVLNSWRASTNLGNAVNDFPWHLTQWAPKDWKGTEQATPQANPWQYKAAEWKRSVVSGALSTTGTTTVASFDLRSDADAAANQGATVRWTRNAFTTAKPQTFEIVPRVARNSAQVGVRVMLNGKQVAYTISGNPTTLRFTTQAGVNNLVINFELTPSKGGKNDVIALSPMMPV